ncbi:hypothetical protein B0O99DRAFT_301563 [Bisporella sp. PMI_857]|nr:hypothetical protein B0O99DRAFT_301563 [Bisporella sp. PMI_857]
MPLWRQKFLTIVDHRLKVVAEDSNPREPSTAAECYIARLPDELLLEILEHSTVHRSLRDELTREESIIPESSQDSSEDGAEQHDVDGASDANGRLRLVCKTWQTTYDEIFFREVWLGSIRGGVNIPRRARLLLATLENRPCLQRYPRSFYLDLDNLGPIACRNIVQIVQLCGNARMVGIHTEHATLATSPFTWPLLDAVNTLKSLETLHVTLPSLHLLFGFLNTSNLKELSIDQYGPGLESSHPFASWLNDFEDEDDRYRSITITESELEELAPRNKYHSWKVTSLRLSDPCCDPNVTEVILRMPEYLEQLNFDELYRSTSASKYDCAMVQQLLDIHRKTLKLIKLGRIPYENQILLDFSQYPCVEKLSISGFDFMSIATPEAALPKLPPFLTHLILDITPVNQHEPFTVDQQVAWVSWLTEFSSLKQSKYPQSRLEEIFIKFEWTEKPRWLTPRNSAPWPWEYLEKAKIAVARFGLTIGYEEPLLPEDMWNELAQRYTDTYDSFADIAEESEVVQESESNVLQRWLEGGREERPETPDS